MYNVSLSQFQNDSHFFPQQETEIAFPPPNKYEISTEVTPSTTQGNALLRCLCCHANMAPPPPATSADTLTLLVWRGGSRGPLWVWCWGEAGPGASLTSELYKPSQRLVSQSVSLSISISTTFLWTSMCIHSLCLSIYIHYMYTFPLYIHVHMYHLLVSMMHNYT